MRRAGFSCNSDELAQRVERGLDATISDLLNYENVPDSPDLFDPSTRNPEKLSLTDIQAYWLYRMVNSPRQLQEKMTLFWHGHFATAHFKVMNASYMLRQNQFFRQFALADFRALLQGVSRDPAMLVWLDNVANTKTAPNENYAREVMELFSLGRGNYSETDIKQAAKAFSGWQVKNGHFWINVQDHDFSTKTVLGVKGRLNGDDIVDILLSQPVASRYMATKLLKFFATDQPDGAWVYRIAQVFSSTGGSVKATVEAIFRSPEFYSDAVMNTMYKSPTEFVVNAMRETGVVPVIRNVPAYMRDMGQELFNPPSVKGWDGGQSWVNTATMLARINFAGYLSGYRSGKFSAANMFSDLSAKGVQTADDVVAHFSNTLGGTAFTEETKAPLVSYLNTSTSGPPIIKGPFTLSKNSVDMKVRNAIRLMLCAPEYQFN
jgi:uncharacterized protein (DUF1800 family)